MKSYTDLEQSKKLAEILPLESADMHYSKDFDGSWFVDLAEYTSVKIPKYVGKVEEHLLPCWSLAALLDVMPPATLNSDNPDIHHYGTYCKGMFTQWHPNPIDSCVEMIVKLKENKYL